MIVEAAIGAAKTGRYARPKSAKEKTRKLGVRLTFGQQRLCGELPFAGTINTLEGDHPVSRCTEIDRTPRMTYYYPDSIPCGVRLFLGVRRHAMEGHWRLMNSLRERTA